MNQDVITRAADSIWPQVSLIMFVLCFVAVLIWTYRGKKDRFRRQAALPFDDESTADNKNGAIHD